MAADDTAASVVIAVFGDSQAQGLAGGLQRVLLEDPRYRVLNRTHPGAALVHNESEWLAPVERFTSREQANIAIVMFGANDRLDLRDESGYLRFRSDEWRQAYAARIDKILTLLRQAGMRIIWCGNPIARSETYSADMGYINDIFAEEATRFGAQFVPLWSVVTDDQGRFVAYGKDRNGTTQRLRNDDGIHFTGAGYELVGEKLAGLLPADAGPAPPASVAPIAAAPIAAAPAMAAPRTSAAASTAASPSAVPPPVTLPMPAQQQATMAPVAGVTPAPTMVIPGTSPVRPPAPSMAPSFPIGTPMPTTPPPPSGTPAQ
ncbi:MAG: DUF459 domain-containing protein [Alphaproteobacteria bacterium]|nr:DUF459 domain-containing protein [Alphaproteobacteria bacterium]